MLHHGTLLFDSDLSMLAKVLKNPGRVANIRPLLKRETGMYIFMRRLIEYGSCV